MAKTIQVLLPLNLNNVYDYKVPCNITIKELDFVKVPFGRQTRIGLVWSCNASNYKEEKLKSIISKIQGVSLLKQDKEFIEFFSKYNMVALGNALSLVIARDGKYFNIKSETTLKIADDIEQISYKNTKARQSIFDYLSKVKTASIQEITANTVTSSSTIKAMLKLKLLQEEVTKQEFKAKDINYKYNEIKLNQSQQKASDFLIAKVNKNEFSTTLLDGVTGSGKTEVFFKLANEVLKQGKQVLILIPEVALSEQMMARFYDRFGIYPYEWNNEQSTKNKKHIYLSCLHGQNCVVLGARSALFLPFKNIGLIVVDEEHDSSYKQEEGIVYNARDMAILKAKIHNVPVLLSSATASLETFVNVKKGNYDFFELNSRFNDIEKPNISVVLHKKRQNGSNKYFSQELLTELLQNLQNNEQSLLFINKRGFASSLHCLECSLVLQCPNCSTYLVEHKADNKLKCHYCGYVTNTINECPSCASKNSFERFGIGIESAYEILSNELPNANITIASSDTLNSKEKIKNFMELVYNKKVDIILATQILAKGHHFKDLTFVGVLDADLTNNSLDLRGAEKTFQVLSQVIGRAGREKKGRGLLQLNDFKNSTLPFVINQDKKGFIQNEITLREQVQMPPFAQLIAVIVASVDANLLETVVNKLYANKPKANFVEIFGPVAPLIFKLRGKYRKRFLLKFSRENSSKVRFLLQNWLKSIDNINKVKVIIDVDPISFY